MITVLIGDQISFILVAQHCETVYLHFVYRSIISWGGFGCYRI